MATNALWDFESRTLMDYHDGLTILQNGGIYEECLCNISMRNMKNTNEPVVLFYLIRSLVFSMQSVLLEQGQSHSANQHRVFQCLN